MHTEEYPNFISSNLTSAFYVNEYVKRLEYARDCGCQTVMLTGQAEPQQNKAFLEKFAMMNKMLKSPFKNIEIQTTGAGIDENYLIFLRDFVGVTTISLSISSFNDDANNIIIHTIPTKTINLAKLCSLIKENGFNLRLSLNVTSALINNKWPDFKEIFDECKNYNADQVTFRKMYTSNSNSPQDKWIKEHLICDDTFKNEADWFNGLNNYIETNGNFIDKLEYGNNKYSVNGISVVVDEDCMAKSKDRQAIKYFILRPNCKLYSKLDDVGSLIF